MDFTLLTPRELNEFLRLHGQLPVSGNEIQQITQLYASLPSPPTITEATHDLILADNYGRTAGKTFDLSKITIQNLSQQQLEQLAIELGLNPKLANLPQRIDRILRILRDNQPPTSADQCQIFQRYTGETYDLAPLLCLQFNSKDISRFLARETGCSNLGYKISRSLVRIASTRIFAQPEQSFLEPPANSVDAYHPGSPIGKFGLGFFSFLYWVIGHPHRYITVISTYRIENTTTLCSWRIRLQESDGALNFSIEEVAAQTRTGTIVCLHTGADPLTDINLSNIRSQLQKLSQITNTQLLYRSDKQYSQLNDRLDSTANGIVWIDISKRESCIRDLASGISLSVLFSSLLTVSVSTKSLSLTTALPLTWVSSTNLKVGSENRLLITVGKLGVVNLTFHTDYALKYLLVIDLPPSMPIPVSRDDVLVQNKAAEQALVVELIKLRDKYVIPQIYDMYLLTKALEAYGNYTRQLKLKRLFDNFIRESLLDLTTKGYRLVPYQYAEVYRQLGVQWGQSHQERFITANVRTSAQLESYIATAYSSKWDNTHYKNRSVGVLALPDKFKPVTDAGLLNYVLVDKSFVNHHPQWYLDIVMIYDREPLSLKVPAKFPPRERTGQKSGRYATIYQSEEKPPGRSVIYAGDKRPIYISVNTPSLWLAQTYQELVNDSQVKEGLGTFLQRMKDNMELYLIADEEAWMYVMTYGLNYAYAVGGLDRVSELLQKLLVIMTKRRPIGRGLLPFKTVINVLFPNDLNFVYNTHSIQGVPSLQYLQLPVYLSAEDTISLSNNLKQELGPQHEKLAEYGRLIQWFILDNNLNFEQESRFLNWYSYNSLFDPQYMLLLTYYELTLLPDDKQLNNFYRLVQILVLRSSDHYIYLALIIILLLNSEVLERILERSAQIVTDLTLSIIDSMEKHFYRADFEDELVSFFIGIKIRPLLEIVGIYILPEIKNRLEHQLTLPLLPKPGISEGYRFTTQFLLDFVFRHSIVEDKFLSYIPQISSWKQGKSPLQILEIAVNLSTGKSYIESVLTETIQNSIDAININSPQDRNIDIDLGQDGNNLVISITDYVGIPERGILAMKIPFLSTKSPSAVVVGEMGSGFFNLYREAREVIIDTALGTRRVVIVDTPLKADNYITDISSVVNITEYSGNPYTRILVYLPFSSGNDKSEKISSVERFIRNVLALLPTDQIPISYNGQLINKKLRTVHRTDIFQFLTAADDFTSQILTKSVPFAELWSYLSNKNLIPIYMLKHLRRQVVLNIAGAYTPVNSRTSLGIKPEKEAELRRFISDGTYLFLLDKILTADDIYLYVVKPGSAKISQSGYKEMTDFNIASTDDIRQFMMQYRLGTNPSIAHMFNELARLEANKNIATNKIQDWVNDDTLERAVMRIFSKPRVKGLLKLPPKAAGRTRVPTIKLSVDDRMLLSGFLHSYVRTFWQIGQEEEEIGNIVGSSFYLNKTEPFTSLSPGAVFASGTYSKELHLLSVSSTKFLLRPTSQILDTFQNPTVHNLAYLGANIVYSGAYGLVIPAAVTNHELEHAWRATDEMLTAHSGIYLTVGYQAKKFYSFSQAANVIAKWLYGRRFLERWVNNIKQLLVNDEYVTLYKEETARRMARYATGAKEVEENERLFIERLKVDPTFRIESYYPLGTVDSVEMKEAIAKRDVVLQLLAEKQRVDPGFSFNPVFPHPLRLDELQQLQEQLRERLEGQG